MKKIIDYTFWKALELSLNFSFLAYLAKVILPVEYSIVGYILIVINISTFIYSIPTAIFTKLYFKDGNEELFSLQFFQVFAIFFIFLFVAFPFIYFLYELELSQLLYFTLICFFNAFRVVQQSVFRVKLNIKSLNIFNIVYPASLWLFYLVFYFFQVELSAESVLLIYVFSFLTVFLFSSSGMRVDISNFSLVKKAVGVKSLNFLAAYFFIQGGAFIFAYSDRIIIALTQAPEIVGEVQFIDNFTSVPFMLISMIYYILQPMIMGNKKYFNVLCRFFFRINVVLFFLFVVIYFAYSAIVKFYIFPFYPAYYQAFWVIDYSLASKLFILMAFLPNIYLICCDKERTMIIYQWLLVLGGAVFCIINININVLDLGFVYLLSLLLSLAYFVSALVISLLHIKKFGG